MTSAIGGADSTRTTTNAEFGLGDVVSNGKGSVFVYVQASEALTANAAVLITEAAASEMVDNTATASAFGDRVGVIGSAFLINEFGWAQIYGAAVVSVGTSAAANTILNTTATAGRLDDDSTAGAEDIPGIVTTASESSNLAACILNYPTVGVTG